MILRTILLVIAISLSGCATYYQNPNSTSIAELVGTFKTRAEFKQFVKEQGYGPRFSKFVVMPGSVDGIVVGLDPVPTYVVSGKRKLGIRVYDKAKRADFIFNVDVVEKSVYQARFKIESQNDIVIIDAWLEDASNGKKITEVQRRQALSIDYPNAPLIL